MKFKSIKKSLQDAKQWDAIDEATKSFIEMQDELMKDMAEGSITKEELDEKLTEALKPFGIKSAADIQVEGKSLEEILKEQGEAITALSGNKEAKPKTFAEMLDEKMPEIKQLFSKKSGAVTLNLKAAATMTTDNTIDETTNSIPAELVESFSIAAFAAKRYGRPFISDIADRMTVSDMEQFTTWLEEGDIEGAFAIVAEGGLKPLVSAELVRNYAEAQKVAGKYVVTEEFAKFRRQAYTILQRIIRDKMVRDYEALLLTGINTEAVGYTGTTLDGTINDANDYDAIAAMIAQAQSLNFNPDVLILNPQDAWRIRLTKDTNGMYVFPVVTANGDTRVFELRLVVSTYQTAGYATIAEPGLYKIEEESISVRVGYGLTYTTGGGNVTSVEDDFDHNRIRVILEMFFKQWLPTPYAGSIVRAQLSTVKAALETP